MDRPDPLNLKSLPQAHAPDDVWPAIQARIRGHTRIWPWTAGLAAVLALSFAAFWLRDAPDTARDHSLAVLQQQSALLESAIAPLRPVAPAAHTAQTEIILESLLAEIDQALFYAPRDTELWARRVELLDTLAATYSDDWMEHQAQLTSL